MSLEIMEQETALQQVEEQKKYLTFSLGEEEFGVDIVHVTEIIGIQKITEMPDSAEYVKGVINLRGKVIPVIDVRLRFHLEERPHDERTCIIVTHVDSTIVGLIVDTVAEVLDIHRDNIDPPISGRLGKTEQHVAGLGRVGEEVKILLDLPSLLSGSALSAA